MEKRQKFKDSKLSSLICTPSHYDMELLDYLMGENQQLRQLACPLSEDCLSVEDYRQKVETFDRGL